MPFKELIANDTKYIFSLILELPLIFIGQIWSLIMCFLILILECLFFLIGNNRFGYWLSGKIYPILDSLTRYVDNKIDNYCGTIERIGDDISYSLTNNTSKKTYIIVTIIIIIHII